LKDWISIGFGLLILVLVCTIFVRISRKVRRGGSGGASLVTLGALYEMHNKDAKRAIETIVEDKAGKKSVEEESPDPLE